MGRQLPDQNEKEKIMDIKEINAQIKMRQYKINKLLKELGYIQESDEVYVTLPTSYSASKLTINYPQYGESVRIIGSDYLGDNKRAVNDSLYRIMTMLWNMKAEREKTIHDMATKLLFGERYEIFYQLTKDGTNAENALDIALNLVKTGA